MGTEIVINQSITLFASKYTYLNLIYCQWQVARKTVPTSWQPKINVTKANVVLEKHTIQYTHTHTHTHV